MIGQMRQTIFNDPNLTLFQSALNDQFSQISQIPFMSGKLIEGIGISAGTPANVSHGLQRTPVGYFVISNTANSVIWNSAFSGTTTLTLNASANTTISIWVF